MKYLTTFYIVHIGRNINWHKYSVKQCIHGWNNYGRVIGPLLNEEMKKYVVPITKHAKKKEIATYEKEKIKQIDKWGNVRMNEQNERR